MPIKTTSPWLWSIPPTLFIVAMAIQVAGRAVSHTHEEFGSETGVLRFVGALVGWAALISVIVVAVMRSKSKRRARAAGSPQPLGYADTGEPIYPTVGYTVDGQALTANRVPGMQAFNPRTNSLATVSLILAFVLTPLAIPFGHVARAQIRRTGEQGAGLALAALIVAYVWMALAVLAVVVFMSASNGRY